MKKDKGWYLVSSKVENWVDFFFTRACLKAEKQLREKLSLKIRVRANI